MANNSQNKIVITRPQIQAERFARMLCDTHEEIGRAHILIEPMLDIVLLPLELDDIAYSSVCACDGLVVSSVHALPAAQKCVEVNEALSLYCVGRRTADEARALGLDVVCVQPRMMDLIETIKAIGKPLDLCYLRGQDVSVDMTRRLHSVSVRVHEFTVYEAKARANVSSSLYNILKAHEVGVVIFFSVRTASVFMSLIQAITKDNGEDLNDLFLNVRFFCLSREIADSLPEFLRAQVVIAQDPNACAMARLF